MVPPGAHSFCDDWLIPKKWSGCGDAPTKKWIIPFLVSDTPFFKTPSQISYLYNFGLGYSLCSHLHDDRRHWFYQWLRPMAAYWKALTGKIKLSRAFMSKSNKQFNSSHKSSLSLVGLEYFTDDSTSIEYEQGRRQVSCSGSPCDYTHARIWTLSPLLLQAAAFVGTTRLFSNYLFVIGMGCKSFINDI